MELVSYALLGRLIVISPGADFILVIRNTLTKGKEHGLATAAGVSLAICIHIAYSLLGISYLISQNTWLFYLIKYLGAGYLIYVGIKGLCFHHKNEIEYGPQGKASELKRVDSFKQGFLCNALNPKTMLFFLSIFSQVLSLSTTFTAIVYGLYMVMLHGLWFSMVAIFFSSRRLQTLASKMQTRLNQVCNGGLIIFGFVLGYRN